MKLLILILTSFIALLYLQYPNQSSNTFLQNQYLDHFKQFQQKYKKNYQTQQIEQYRFQIFIQNLQSIINYQGQPFGISKFMDLTTEEYQSLYLMNIFLNEQPQEFVQYHLDQDTKQLDWVAKGAVQRVKNQGLCNGCWAFGAAGVLESYYFINYGELPDLSEQQLIDCSRWLDDNQGCVGGMHNRALNHARRYGMTTTDNYPYVEYQQVCKIKGGEYKVNGSKFIEPNEEAFIAALQQQPLAIFVDAVNWQFYNVDENRILSECGSNQNHVVVAVGYDEESIKVKNSVGTDWGDKGYIYLKRGQNTCQMYSYAIIPI